MKDQFEKSGQEFWRFPDDDFHKVCLLVPTAFHYGLRIHVTPSTIKATAPTKMITPVGRTMLNRMPTPRNMAQSPPDLPPGPHRRNKNTPCAVLLSQSTQGMFPMCLIQLLRMSRPTPCLIFTTQCLPGTSSLLTPSDDQRSKSLSLTSYFAPIMVTPVSC